LRLQHQLMFTENYAHHGESGYILLTIPVRISYMEYISKHQSATNCKSYKNKKAIKRTE
jgi:hypothetical protein